MFKIYYFSSSTSTWEYADSSGETSTKNLLGLALGMTGTTQGFLLDGWTRNTSTVPLTGGLPVYLNGTTGGFNTTAPASGFVRVVGWMVENNILYFRPDCTWIEL